ncbi:MAG: DUF2066 domain-containing protein [Alphaproteobacteria bacterium]|nr:DUF2066 domain-containing protein [Alphaproteobacteria bacterium]
MIGCHLLRATTNQAGVGTAMTIGRVLHRLERTMPISVKTWLFVLMMSGFALHGGTAAAQNSNVFGVNGIGVTSTNAREDLARNQSLQQAVLRAFDIVVARLVTPDSLIRLKEARVPLREKQKLVDRQQILREEFGGGKYIATVSVRFRSENMRRFLKNNGYVFSDIAAPTMVVLPILKQDGEEFVFPRRRNPMFAELESYRYGHGLVPLRVPNDSLTNRGAITPATIASRKRKIARDLGFRNVVVIAYDADTETLQYQISASGFPSPTQRTIRGMPLVAALRQAHAAMQNDWRAGFLYDDQYRQGQTVRLLLDGDNPLMQWSEGLARINQFHVTERVVRKELATTHGVIEVTYHTDDASFGRILSQSGFRYDDQALAWIPPTP